MSLILTILTMALYVFLGFALVYGVPIYFIYRDKSVSDSERLLWIIACIVVPWVPFLVFMLIAPVTQRSSS